jgi:hypothetical protein
MALYGPVTLLVLPVFWLALILLGYTAMFIALGIDNVSRAITISGSSLLTLGFSEPTELPRIVLAFSEATIGLGLVALLIAYLPAMYAAWSRREQTVAMLQVRAGSPPSAREMIRRFNALQRLDRLNEIWPEWETWFVDIEETHTSLAAITFFRSPQPQRSWVTAAGAVLDTGSFVASTVDAPRNPDAELMLRAGYLALRSIADFFVIPHNSDPHFPADPITISREEYDEMYDELAAQGVHLKANREQAGQLRCRSSRACAPHHGSLRSLVVRRQIARSK